MRVELGVATFRTYEGEAAIISVTGIMVCSGAAESTGSDLLLEAAEIEVSLLALHYN